MRISYKELRAPCPIEQGAAWKQGVRRKVQPTGQCRSAHRGTMDGAFCRGLPHAAQAAALLLSRMTSLAWKQWQCRASEQCAAKLIEHPHSPTAPPPAPAVMLLSPGLHTQFKTCQQPSTTSPVLNIHSALSTTAMHPSLPGTAPQVGHNGVASLLR